MSGSEYEYKTVSISTRYQLGDAIRLELTQREREGWRFVSQAQGTGEVVLIFRRAKRAERRLDRVMEARCCE